MDQILFISASCLALLWLIVHLIAGGRQIIAPAWQVDALPPVVRNTLYLCWHFTSLAIFATAAVFGLAALGHDQVFAMVGIGLAAGFAVIGIGMQIALRDSFFDLPQGWLFLPVALLGIAGLVV